MGLELLAAGSAAVSAVTGASAAALLTATVADRGGLGGGVAALIGIIVWVAVLLAGGKCLQMVLHFFSRDDEADGDAVLGDEKSDVAKQALQARAYHAHKAPL